ncbi:hypothetical protein OKW30_001423 [Paraburkholderia sp. Clong3]|uniref:phage antirepressor KilAC domain-containing protein n=1 Tax=Paraburkholderia sp. Clong3 TaxID=2991061 RepID=UPI003D1A77BF
MPLIPFPDVPALPGVPDLNRLPTAIGVRTGATQLLQGLDYFGLLPSNTPQWIIADRNGNALVGYQEKVQAGYLEHKVTEVSRSDGSEKLVEQVRVTPKGLTRLAHILASN